MIETAPGMLLAAADLATDHQFSICDAVILLVASQSGCRLLLSEELQDGFTWGGVTVANPFTSPCHALPEPGGRIEATCPVCHPLPSMDRGSD